MSFNRLRGQTLCESWCGCTDLSLWNSYTHTLESIVLDKTKASELQTALQEDAADIYLKGIQSLVEAISSCRASLFSWATIKAYYSVFYFLRSSLALRGYAVVRNKSLYLVHATDGSTPQKKGGNKYRNDHIGIINMYRDLYSTSDKLQSNLIDSTNAYEWLMEKRNQIHYREREFHDPTFPDFFSELSKSITAQNFESQIESYINDMSYIFCFQPDHAVLALPIRLAILLRDEFIKTGIVLTPAREKTLMLHTIACGPKCNFTSCLFSKLAVLVLP